MRLEPDQRLVAVSRDLFGNPTVGAAHEAWPLQHPLAATLAWTAILLAVFVPLSTRRYQQAGR